MRPEIDAGQCQLLTWAPVDLYEAKRQGQDTKAWASSVLDSLPRKHRCRSQTGGAATHGNDQGAECDLIPEVKNIGVEPRRDGRPGEWVEKRGWPRHTGCGTRMMARLALEGFNSGALATPRRGGGVTRLASTYVTGPAGETGTATGGWRLAAGGWRPTFHQLPR